jgi:hypothetical protein
MIPGQSMALGAPPISLNGTAPRCQHFEGLAPVMPQADHCRDCQAQAAVAADSPSHHARAHYEETDHPVAARLRSERSWRWCYVHQRLV